MFWTAKITSKGRITLPKGLREYLKLRPGDWVTFGVQGEIVILEPCGGGDILDWYGALEGQGKTDNPGAVRESVRRAIAEEPVREGRITVGD
jgi:AbrB family looped-hinge helix DNA binding protein